MNPHVYTLYSAFVATHIEIPKLTSILTKPYCNCREQGFVLSLEAWDGAIPEQIHYAFYDHRNSDSLCVVKWTGTINITGGVTPADFPEGVFEKKNDYIKSWNYMNIAGVLDWFKEEVKGFTMEVLEFRERKKIAEETRA